MIKRLVLSAHFVSLAGYGLTVGVVWIGCFSLDS